jgi:hypothetical protein
MSDSIFVLGTRIFAITSGLLAVLTLIAWSRQSNWRFALVGYTAFCLVLTAGCWGLSLGPIMPTTIAGAAHYKTVYDRGADQAVIAVDPTITPEELTPTLLQASRNLLTSGRYSSSSTFFTVRARTVIHPQPGVSIPLYLGQTQQPLLRGTQITDPEVAIFSEGFKQLQAYEAAAS